MKRLLIASMLIANAMFLFTACETEQPVDQLLKDDPQRSKIISSFVNHQPYRMEMMNAMMQNDSCQLLMGHKMMEKPEMMHMMMSDPEKMKGTMDHMVNLAAEDSTMLNDMIQMMKERPEMWNKVMEMNSSINKTN
jgi:hypothetical protein